MPEKKLKTCEVCGKKVVKMRDHMNIHRPDKPYKCTICHKRFTQRTNLTRHVRIHALETVKAFKCEVCQKSFSRKSNLTVHVQMVHKKERNFSCDFCEKDFTTNHNLWNHLLRHTQEKPYTCELCGEGFCEIGQRNQHLRSHLQERVHKCEICNMSYIGESGLRRHKKTHLKEGPQHFCIFCSKGFHEKSDLFRHILVHLKENPYLCQQCDACFNQASARTSHVRRCHRIVTKGQCSSSLARQEAKFNGKEKLRHECIFCAKTFLQKSELQSHIMTHVQEKPFACKFCDVSFSQSSNKIRHVWRVHGKVAGA